jgi:hypothetical protein
MSADHEPVVAEVNPSNVRFLGDTFASLRADFPDFSDVLGRDLYSLPEPLIDAMVTATEGSRSASRLTRKKPRPMHWASTAAS